MYAITVAFAWLYSNQVRSPLEFHHTLSHLKHGIVNEAFPISWLLRCRSLVFPFPKGTPILTLPKIVGKIMSWLRLWNGNVGKNRPAALSRVTGLVLQKYFSSLLKKLIVIRDFRIPLRNHLSNTAVTKACLPN